MGTEFYMEPDQWWSEDLHPDQIEHYRKVSSTDDTEKVADIFYNIVEAKDPDEETLIHFLAGLDILQDDDSFLRGLYRGGFRYGKEQGFLPKNYSERV